MMLLVDLGGQVRCLYSELIDLETLGSLSIRRASRVEPDGSGQWWAHLNPIGGPRLGPFRRRSEALTAEVAWIEEYVLSGAGPGQS
jgi:hypothetical protein